MIFPAIPRNVVKALSATAFAVALLSGCKSEQDKAIDQAKQQAAATGQAQQVVTTDKSGNTTTTVVQPPAPGQTTQQVTTTTTSTKTGTVSAATPPATTVGPVQPVPPPPAATTPAGTTDTAGPAPTPYGPAPTGTPAQPVASAVSVHVPAGTSLVIRINQHINVKTSHVGERFTGEVAEAVASPDGGQVLIARGTPVGGVVDASHRRGHFKGASILELRLTSMTVGGQQYALDTHDVVRTKKGKGKRSAAFIGGGSGLGMLIGGVATGGVGLVVGGLAGGGAGTALAGMTGNRDIDIPAESLMRFKLADDLVVQPGM